MDSISNESKAILLNISSRKDDKPGWKNLIAGWCNYCSHIIKCQKEKNIFRRAFGSWTEGVSGFATITAKFSNGKIGVVRWAGKVANAYNTADREDRSLLGPRAQMSAALANTLNVYGALTLSKLDEWVGNSAERFIEKDGDLILRTVQEIMKNEKGHMSLKFFPKALKHFEKLENAKANLNSIIKKEEEYEDWKGKLKSNILADDLDSSVLEVLKNEKATTTVRKSIENEKKLRSDKLKNIKDDKEEEEEEEAEEEEEKKVQNVKNETIAEENQVTGRLGYYNNIDYIKKEILKLKDFYSKQFGSMLKNKLK